MKRIEIELDDRKLRLKKLDMDQPIASRPAYEEQLERLQSKMLSVQRVSYQERRRSIVVLEGWDAAGKGGAIRRLTEKLDPRGYQVYPIGPPSAEEQGRHYLYRFWQKLPPPGTIAIFDRSWYGRVLVERVEGFARKPEWKRAFDEINEFEHQLLSDGVRVVKCFLHITAEEQLERFAERLTNPEKNWKIGEDDLRNRARWDDYVQAIEDMFDKTSTVAAPWHLVSANHKWVARVEVLRAVTKALGKGLDLRTPAMDPNAQAEMAERLGIKLK